MVAIFHGSIIVKPGETHQPFIVKFSHIVFGISLIDQKKNCGNEYFFQVRYSRKFT